jgi:hypothetical protein
MRRIESGQRSNAEESAEEESLDGIVTVYSPVIIVRFEMKFSSIMIELVVIKSKQDTAKSIDNTCVSACDSPKCGVSPALCCR